MTVLATMAELAKMAARVSYDSGVAYDSGDRGVGYAGHVGYNGSDGGAAMMADMLAMMVANGGIGYDGRMKVLAMMAVIEVLARMVEWRYLLCDHKGTDRGNIGLLKTLNCIFLQTFYGFELHLVVCCCIHPKIWKHILCVCMPVCNAYTLLVHAITLS